MITRHHVALTILCTMILSSALVPSDPVLTLVIYTGAGVGTIMPDVQMKKPRASRIRMIAWLISGFSRVVFTPLICRLYGSLRGGHCDPRDKRLTHSIPGILLMSGILAVILLVLAIILTAGSPMNLTAAFLCGMMLGLVLHQIEDMCTRKGITPLFPFSTITVSGSIRPCDTTDRRIPQFHFYYCSVAGIILGFQYLGSIQGIASVPLCLFGAGSCLGMMVWSSDVGISHEFSGEQVPRTRIPVPSDPFIFQWKTDFPASGLRMGVYFLIITGNEN